MTKELSILLIEDDELTCRELKQAIEKHDDLKLVATTNDSTHALELLRSHLPNIVLLDLELHHGGGNGLLFLSELQKLRPNHPPYILVTTNNMSDVTLEQARQLGADFTLTKYEKGYSADYVIENILLMRPAILKKNTMIASLPDMSPAEEEELLVKRIKRELDLVGIKPKAVGYNYLVDAILLLVQGSDANIARTLAPKYKKTEKSIERAMQNAIKQAWNTNDIEDLLNYYTAKIRSDKGCPTLMEFVYYYADRIKDEMGLRRR